MPIFWISYQNWEQQQYQQSFTFASNDTARNQFWCSVFVCGCTWSGVQKTCPFPKTPTVESLRVTVVVQFGLRPVTLCDVKMTFPEAPWCSVEWYRKLTVADVPRFPMQVCPTTSRCATHKIERLSLQNWKHKICCLDQLLIRAWKYSFLWLLYCRYWPCESSHNSWKDFFHICSAHLRVAQVASIARFLPHTCHACTRFATALVVLLVGPISAPATLSSSPEKKKKKTSCRYSLRHHCLLWHHRTCATWQCGGVTNIFNLLAN